jgi:hypothetical protein
MIFGVKVVHGVRICDNLSSLGKAKEALQLSPPNKSISHKHDHLFQQFNLGQWFVTDRSIRPPDTTAPLRLPQL